MKLFINILLLIESVNCYIFSYPANIYKKKYNDKIIKIYEPENIKRENLDCLLFFTGGNSLIPGDLYNNFISSLVDYKYSVSVLPNDFIACNQYIKDIQNKYSSIIPISHSSGCVNIINLIKFIIRKYRKMRAKNKFFIWIIICINRMNRRYNIITIYNIIVISCNGIFQIFK